MVHAKIEKNENTVYVLVDIISSHMSQQQCWSTTMKGEKLRKYNLTKQNEKLALAATERVEKEKQEQAFRLSQNDSKILTKHQQPSKKKAKLTDREKFFARMDDLAVAEAEVQQAKVQAARQERFAKAEEERIAESKMFAKAEEDKLIEEERVKADEEERLRRKTKLRHIKEEEQEMLEMQMARNCAIADLEKNMNEILLDYEITYRCGTLIEQGESNPRYENIVNLLEMYDVLRRNNFENTKENDWLIVTLDTEFHRHIARRW